MNVVILQPSYIPWRGYFHQIQKADIFVFYDDVQYDKRGWRNRNQIKTSRGLQWLSIPVYSRGAQTENIPINQIKTVWDSPWNQSHWKALQNSYGKAPYFNNIAPWLQEFYTRHDTFLADFTIDLTIAITRKLGNSHTQFLRSSGLNASGSKTDRLIAVLKEIGADHYISGPSAQDYIEPEKFQRAGISLEYMTYNYPEYPQLYPPFESHVSVLDLMFMCGQKSMHYITGEE